MENLSLTVYVIVLYRLFSMAPKPFDPASFDPSEKPPNWTKAWVQYGLNLDNQAWNQMEYTVVEYLMTHPHINDLRAHKDEVKELSQIPTSRYFHVLSEPGRFAPSWFDHSRTTRSSTR